MIDRENLEKSINTTQIVLLERIRKLGEAAKLLDEIKLEVDHLSNNDKALKHFIATQLRRRNLLAELEKEWEKMEESLWDKMLDIDIPD